MVRHPARSNFAVLRSRLSGSKTGRRLSSAVLVVVLATALLPMSAAQAEYQPGIPPAVDPGTPTFGGAANPVPPEPAPFDPSASRLQAIYDADIAAGGTSFWFDRVLARPFLDGIDDTLFSRGRALYMYQHTEQTLGFAGGFAYRERPTATPTNLTLYSIAVTDFPVTEVTAERVTYPSYWSSVHTATDLRIAQRKFITDNNVAVTLLTITNTGATPTSRTLVATSPIATTSAGGGTELTGTLETRYNATTITARFSGTGFAVSGTTLTRTINLDPGASTTVKLVLGTIAAEIPASAADYVRFRDYEAETAFKTHLREYNRWWVDNVPYIDIPDQNVKKLVYYRTFLNRYNFSDANIPGNDHQFPVSIEGVRGYNNAIQLTQPMHLQDLKYFRDPYYSYGDWVSSGETSKCTAFTDNPGSFSWGNTYEQYIGREGWQAYKVHGGDPQILRNFARYVECDVKGQLAKYDQNGNNLIAYANGALTGNDADAVALAFYQRAQDRTESAFWYSGAKAAAEAYTILGDTAKAAEMNGIAQNIKNAVLTFLWDDSAPVPIPPTPGPPATRIAGQLGNALPLNGSNGEYVDLPDGIVAGLNDFTISTWVNPTSTATWSRIFDFGSGPMTNMFLTINGAGNGLRFAITINGGGAEQQINRTNPGTQLPLNTWSHVAVTLSGNVGTMYLNGQVIGTNPNMTLRPSSLGATTNDWIGRSQYGDPLYNGAVDDFQIYDHALSAAEVAALAGPPATQGAGNVASYRFDEDAGNTVLDSSPNGRNGTVIIPDIPGDSGGKVFKQKDVLTGNLVPWKDQQNFVPFIEGIPPNTDNYKLALRFYADKDEFPIMPSYTANQTDKAAAVAAGRGGSNNFSNINSTLQAQLYARALREYPSQYVTPDMYRKLIEWLTWNEYINGDNRFPDNNEFFFNWDPVAQTLGRSGIHHNILGAYNFMIIEDIAGMRPRLDDTVELWPIDMGYSHFTVNNLSYHGRDLTIVWDRPGDGTAHYGGTPEGYSLYVDGVRVFTVDDLVHVTWDSATGAVDVPGGDADVVFDIDAPLDAASDISLSNNPRVVDMFQKAGVDLSADTHWAVNLAQGRPVTASFTATTPTVRSTAPEYAVDGWTISGLPIQQGAYLARNTIWGTQGSPNSQDWLEIDLGSKKRFDTVKLYFFSDKTYMTQSNGSGNTYREPSAYSLQYFDGSAWVDVPGQAKSPAMPLPNYNRDTFPSFVTDRIRLLATRTGTFGIGVKEIQVFDTNPTPFVTNSTAAGTATVQYSDGFDPDLTIAALDPDTAGSSLTATATGLPAGLSLALASTSTGGTLPGTRTWTVEGATTAAPGDYQVTVDVGDGEGHIGTTTFTITVAPEDADATYTGDGLVLTASGATSANVVLRATVRDSSELSGGDTTAGDIRKATLTFKEGTTTLCGPLPVELLGAETTIGTASCSKTLAVGAHRIDIYVNGYYTGIGQGLVEVAEPDGSFITGGGSVVAEASAGKYPATDGTSEDFAFNIKYTKGFKNLKGHASVVFESAGKTYEIRSTAIDSLGIVLQAPGGGACAGPPSATCFGLADFRSKANLLDITNPLAPITVDSNLSLQITMTDRGEPGPADTIGISLWKGNTLLFSSEWNGAKTIEANLDAGNLVVH
jgi:hypothetical protein